MWPVQGVACPRRGRSQVWPVPGVAGPRCGRSQVWPVPGVACPRCGLSQVWPVPGVAGSWRGRSQVWPVPGVAASRHGYFDRGQLLGVFHTVVYIYIYVGVFFTCWIAKYFNNHALDFKEYLGWVGFPKSFTVFVTPFLFEICTHSEKMTVSIFHGGVSFSCAYTTTRHETSQFGRQNVCLSKLYVCPALSICINPLVGITVL